MAEHEPSIGGHVGFIPPEYFEGPNLALSRRKQGFESPRERHQYIPSLIFLDFPL